MKGTYRRGHRRRLDGQPSVRKCQTSEFSTPTGQSRAIESRQLRVTFARASIVSESGSGTLCASGWAADIEAGTQEQQARWLLANVLDWHRRENEAVWWEYFRLSVLSSEELFDELIDEPTALSMLGFVQQVGGTAKAPIHRYTFPIQETELVAEGT
jgi:hypothetical protein